MTRSVLVLALLLSLSACASSGAGGPAIAPGPPVDIATPPSGSLTDAQLRTIAEDIRELEQNPLGAGAPEARVALIRWITNSPDIHASLCGNVNSDLLNSRSRYHSELFGHFITGLGAHLIENPEDEGNAAATNLGAMESTLTAYRALLARDPAATDRFLDGMLARKESGTLAEHIANASASC